MHLDVDILTPEQWKTLSADAHKSVFHEIMPEGRERLDLVIMMVTKDDAGFVQRIHGYITCRELDSDSLYLIYGGAFPGTHSTSLSFPAYSTAIAWAKKKYKKIGMLVENTNAPMLKFAMKSGFLITGLRVYEGKIMLENSMDGEK
jgi:hypothetical protein